MRPADLLRRSVLATVAFAVAASVASAMPILMDRYNNHPLSRPANRGQCVICHVHADGSGELTAFGKKYDRADLEFTPELMGEYPNLFLVEGAPAATAAEPSAAPGPAVVVPGNEPFDARQYYLAECTECHGKYGDGDPFQGVPAFATQKWIAERSGRTEELVDIILNGKDKMIGHIGKITESDARELLELIRKIAEKYS